MKTYLTKLTQGQTLTSAEAYDAFVKIGSGEANAAQMAAFVTVFLMRSITSEELKGFREAMLSLCVKVDLQEFEPVDIVGTGGDGKNTFNISTLSAFVAAGAGVKVAKHGNYAVSSQSGSSNVLESLGVTFTNNQDLIKKQIDKAGITFFHAPLFHPAMKNVAPVRKELGMKTFFNMLGPLTNPAHVKKRAVGVYNLEMVRLYHSLLQHTDERYLIIHAVDGYDEISLTGKVKIVSNEFEKLLSPEAYGFPTIKPEQIFGGNSVAEASEIFKNIIEGRGTEAQNNVVIANAATAIWVNKVGIDITEAQAIARESLTSLKAKEVLEKLISCN